MVKTEAEETAAKYKKLGKLQKQNGKNAEKIARYNSQTEKLRRGEGHGVAILMSEQNVDDQIADAQKAVDDSKKRKDKAKENRDEAKRDLALKRINEGKGKAIVLYNEKQQPVDIYGNVVKSECLKGKQKEKGKKNDDSKKTRSPKGKFSKKTRWGHDVLQLYQDSDGELYAVVSKDGKLTWATGYNVNSGFWKSAVKTTDSQINSKTKNLTLVADNGGTSKGESPKPCKRGGN